MIQRHHSELFPAIDSFRPQFDKLHPVLIKHLSGKTAENLGKRIDHAIRVFALCEVNDVDRQDCLKYLRHVRDLGVGNFLYASHLNEEVRFSIDGDSVELTATTADSFKHTALWLKSLWAAIISRSDEGRQNLLNTPKFVFENANIKPNSFDLVYVDLLKGLFDENADIEQLFIDISETTNPDVLEIERQDYIYDISVPVTKLIYDLLRNKESEFNKELESALESHKKFWSKSDRKDEYDGWVSLPLLAICSLAFDKGFNITVESEYIPKWLYEKDF